MISPSPTSLSAGSGGAARRSRYSRSPAESASRAKRSKYAARNEFYERSHMSRADPNYSYTSLCVRNLHPKLSDLDVRELCNKKFSRYGTNSVRVHYKDRERMAYVNFASYDDAKKARHGTSGLVWENIPVNLEPVYYRRPLPPPLLPDRPPKRASSRERSPLIHRYRGPPTAGPSPSQSYPLNGRYRLRNQHTISPDYYSSRRHYGPYIPLPPDLIDYGKPTSTRHDSYHRPPSSSSHRSTSSTSSPKPSTRRSSSVEDATRTLIVENVDRETSEARLKDMFGRYGTIDNIELKKSHLSSKCVCAVIQYENVDMAHKARETIHGQPIGKYECQISYGKSVASKYLWVGNIPMGMRRHDIEHAFSRYGQIKQFDYTNGDPTAIITYKDVDDAVKARTHLIGTVQGFDGRLIRHPVHGLRIDYLEKPTQRRFVIVRPQSRTSPQSPSPEKSPASSHSSRRSSAAENHSRSASRERESSATPITLPKTEALSRSTTPSIVNSIKQRRSTDRSEASSVGSLVPIAGRTFYSPLGSYLSPHDTTNVHDIRDLMILCEQLNASATQHSTALSTVYPVQFILKSHAYDARLHYLAGSPTLASLLLGQPGDLVAAKTELKISQRLRLDQHKLEDLERNLRTNVTNALAALTHPANNGLLNNETISISDRKLNIAANQTRFVILIASPKMPQGNPSAMHTTSETVKNEAATPPHPSSTDGTALAVPLKSEMIERPNEPNEEDDETSLSRLISYLVAKEAAGVISIPFYPTYLTDYGQSPKQEIAVLHIFPPCEFSERILKLICPSIEFSPSMKQTQDEHLMLVIVHND